MTDSHPRISIIMPAYNAERFIADAIRSLLTQPIKLDIIVINDGSTDRTSSRVREFGDAVRPLDVAKNEGLPSALNHGLRLVRNADYIGFLDSDDIWSEDRLPLQLRLLGENPEVAAVWGKSRIVFMSDDGQETESPQWPPRFFPQLATFLFRAAVFDQIGRFDERFRHAQDTDFLARLKEAGLRVLQHDDVVLTWRRHEANMTNQVALDRDYLASALREALRRRRGGIAKHTG